MTSEMENENKVTRGKGVKGPGHSEVLWEIMRLSTSERPED
jgi:hypothetical protein